MVLARDVPTFMRCLLAYHEEGLDREVVRHFGLADKTPDLSKWKRICHVIANPEGEVNIAIVGKYTSLQDSYKSLGEALVHGGIANGVKVNIDWIDSELFEKKMPPHRICTMLVVFLCREVSVNAVLRENPCGAFCS